MAWVVGFSTTHHGDWAIAAQANSSGSADLIETMIIYSLSLRRRRSARPDTLRCLLDMTRLCVTIKTPATRPSRGLCGAGAPHDLCLSGSRDGCTRKRDPFYGRDADHLQR